MPTKNNPQRVLYCDCAYSSIIPDLVKQEIKDRLSKSDAEIITVSDLCAQTARKDPRLAVPAGMDSLTIAACYPRTLHSLFEAADQTLPEDVTFLNMRDTSTEEIEKILPDSPSQKTSPLPAIEKDGDWVPWFPVIDYQRCSNCKQCASFCIFGVYSIDENDKVQVSHPQGCKNNCPACARICPEAAIIFPKYPDSPINGDEIHDEDLVKANIKINVDAILGDDVYKALAERRKKAKRRLLNQKAKKQALEERKQFKKDADLDAVE